ncbi:MAG: 50S ribosomal protein L18e [Candidatus Woesearchaeota archaeon]
MKMTYTTNINLRKLVDELKKKSAEENVKIWKRIATDLERPTRIRRLVNISKLNRFTKKDDVIVVPGKVLGSGDIDHSVTVAAFTFSEQAKEKINKMGKAISLAELLKKNPKGKNVKIMG